MSISPALLAVARRLGVACAASLLLAVSASPARADILPDPEPTSSQPSSPSPAPDRPAPEPRARAAGSVGAIGSVEAQLLVGMLLAGVFALGAYRSSTRRHALREA